MERKTLGEVKVTKGKFDPYGAAAFAFMFGFLPPPAVQIRKSKHNSDRKSKHSPQLPPPLPTSDPD
ncbi:hypothetical protein [Paenibacillus sp. FSL L8-0463]|uniref:hypothetical protein n=1 Tax=Paenibacillus sp. FSL L8-0463 TaxID=2954687 RepID=UPI00311A348D